MRKNDTFLRLLESRGACHEACLFAAKFDSFKEAYDACAKLEWLYWLARLYAPRALIPVYHVAWAAAGALALELENALRSGAPHTDADSMDAYRKARACLYGHRDVPCAATPVESATLVLQMVLHTVGSGNRLEDLLNIYDGWEDDVTSQAWACDFFRTHVGATFLPKMERALLAVGAGPEPIQLEPQARRYCTTDTPPHERD